ncbi:major histocompatibility complex class I-related gene protein-like isoform X2 [Hoplias malabaricus]|uniref:major histocompatibility complex class I-related gene protein-like isoform X2 n=1 Tax=Hoplias malabaricus TaxID=27720 RepID=UPI00346226FA
MKGLFTLLMLVIPHSVFTGSHSLGLFSIYIKGDTPFPEFSFWFMLDDLTVSYFDSEKKTLFSRDHHKEDEVDTVVDPHYIRTIMSTMRDEFEERRIYAKQELNTSEMKPRVRLIQKKRSVSGWDGVSCLATGFYPRHINLTILRDGEPVPERLITGGELLPNGDGTYQMRKNLKLRGQDLKQSVFTCSVTHLGLDNKLDVHLEFDPGDPIWLVVIPVVMAVGLVCVVVGTGICVMRKCRREKTASPQSGSEPSSTEEREKISLDASENYNYV